MWNTIPALPLISCIVPNCSEMYNLYWWRGSDERTIIIAACCAAVHLCARARTRVTCVTVTCDLPGVAMPVLSVVQLDANDGYAPALGVETNVDNYCKSGLKR